MTHMTVLVYDRPVTTDLSIALASCMLDWTTLEYEAETADTCCLYLSAAAYHHVHLMGVAGLTVRDCFVAFWERQGLGG